MTERQKAALSKLFLEADLLTQYLDTVIDKRFMEQVTYAHTQFFRDLPRRLTDLDDAYRKLRSLYEARDPAS